MRYGIKNCEFKIMTKYSKKRLGDTNKEVEGGVGYELNMLAHCHECLQLSAHPNNRLAVASDRN